MPKTSKKSSPVDQVSSKLAAAAFAAIQPELATVTPEEIPRINIDIGRAVAVALGALPHLRALRPAIQKELPKHPIELLEKLETYALGAWYAHLLATPSSGGSAPMTNLIEEATPLRASLLVAAEALAHRGLVDAARVAEIRRGQGHIDLASDLVALSALFHESWDRVSKKTAIELREVERAAALGPELLKAHGERGQPLGSSQAKDAAESRLRAFALFVRAYDACQRAVEYLRWNEEDAGAITPSLFKGRGGRPRLSETEPDTAAPKTEAASPEQEAPA
jgi:hypothetical protein